jgi:4-amino-4-deoxy-L-arabinose transferase-like glycosyltransferase
MRRSLDPRGIRAAIVLSLFGSVANGVWIFIDNSAPSWDQSHYLDVAWQYQQALNYHGFVSFLQTIHHADPSHGPLFTIFILPFFYLFGDSARSGLLLNFALAPILYLSAGEIAMHFTVRWQARLLTIVLVATMPLLVGLYHNDLQDFLLVTITTGSLLLLLKSDRFRRRGICLALGVTMGFGTLTKVTFPLFVLGPLLVVLAWTWVPWFRERLSGYNARGKEFRRTLLNIVYALCVFLVVTVPWYGPNASATVEYIRSTTSGPLSIGAGPSNPYTFHAVFAFTSGVLNEHVSWIVGLVGIVAILVNISAISAWFRTPVQTWKLLGAAFLLSWVMVPFASVALAHNQDVRLMAPVFPGIAIIVSGSVTAVRWTGLRLTLISFATLALVYQTVNRVSPLGFNFMPQKATVTIDSQPMDMPLASSAPMGYERLPEGDFAGPVIDYIEAVAKHQTHGELVAPQVICMLESEPVVNSNTFGFVSNVRNDPFTFVNVVMGPQGEEGLASTLKGCDFALYVRQPGATPATASSRLTLVNAEFAAGFMTPRLFANFRRPSRSFPMTEEASQMGDQPSYLSPPATDLRVQVLVRH